jgi:ketosteroid isomerase-like protein
MEASNVELCGLAVAAFNAREVPEEILADDFHMENRVSAVTDYSYHGAVGWREWMSDLLEEFASGARYRIDELIAVGEDFVAAMFSVAGRGVHSGEPLELRWAGVTWFRDGKATRAIGYASRSEALDALGLRR